MSKKKRRKFKNGLERREKRGRFALPGEIRQMIFGILLILLAVIISLSFFEKAGKGGQFFMRGGRFLIGDVLFLVPLILILAGLAFLTSRYRLKYFVKESKIFGQARQNFLEKNLGGQASPKVGQVILATVVLILGLTGILGVFNNQARRGGWLGYVLNWPLLKYFGNWVSLFIFLTLIIIGSLIFWHFLRFPREKKPSQTSQDKTWEGKQDKSLEDKPSIIRRIFTPKFKVKEVPPFTFPETTETKEISEKTALLKLEAKSIEGGEIFPYRLPPLDFLEPDRGIPTSGDTRINSAVIKKTLQNFGIEVAMSEVNIGPTVTQYTLKPAEGIKLAKITALSNDLSLALASHPIRIEAPIPGRSLVGIEIPNKVRAQVRLRNLIENPNFQKSSSDLIIALGRDVSGIPIYADLTRMPHLLVAGSTGSGKTAFLNTLILSLLYQPSTSTKSASPRNLRFILVDPKRVEFSIYNNLPHLLCPVIYDANKTIGTLKWLTSEMERRFDVLSEVKARDIGSFNEKALKDGSDPLPFIVLIIDELADLMAAKGREVEAGIVRLSQMARAVGIHLVVATQRPSVEVITGLIKANITSRITFQVASQVDSRTVLDTAGAEKLLGLGDMLYISAQVSKPKRVQAAYVSEKEVKKVVKHIISKNGDSEYETKITDEISHELEGSLIGSEKGTGVVCGEDEPLYEEAKRLVIEAKKASASLLQRRLRIGYARAARLIDILEEKGIVGPGEGAKPRDVYGESVEAGETESSENDKGWEKV